MIIKHTNPKQDLVLKLWFSSKQDYNFVTNLESRRKNTQFQKKRDLKRWSDVPVRSFWSCKTEDWAGTVAKNCEYCKNYPPKPEKNCTTGKFMKFYPITKKISPDLESGWPSYGLSKSGCQMQNQFGEGFNRRTAMLNLTVVRPSQQFSNGPVWRPNERQI